MTPPASTKTSLGLDQNLAAGLTYLLGFITGVLFLIVEKDNRFVRFHAIQSTITFAGVLVADLVLWAVPLVGWLFVPVFTLGVVALWLWLMFKAVSGVEYKLPYIGEMAEKQL